MNNAMREIFNSGYNRVVLIGSDIPSVRHENIERAFDSLNHSDLVIGPSEDGGYWLICMKKFIPDAFNISRYGDSSVLDSTIKKLNDSGIIYNLADTLQDLDTPDDIKIFMSQANNQDRKTYKYLRKNKLDESYSIFRE